MATLRNTAASVVAASAVLLTSQPGWPRPIPWQRRRVLSRASGLLPTSQPTSTGKNGDRSWHDTGGQP